MHQMRVSVLTELPSLCICVSVLFDPFSHGTIQSIVPHPVPILCPIMVPNILSHLAKVG